MTSGSRLTLLAIQLPEERYGVSFVGAVALHVSFAAMILVLPYVLPRPDPILIGSGPGGGIGGESYSVGIADEPSGGAGMVKPSIIPQPPALLEPKPEVKPPAKAIPLPDTVKEKKRPTPAKSAALQKQAPAASTVVPTEAAPGAGGIGGASSGSGGGRGGGHGVLIGTGSGGFGDSWYARAVESRISSNWIRPGPGIRVEIVYSFFIAANGTIYDIKREKSSGNEALDLTAERAVRASNPLAAPPPHLRSRPLQFVAEFYYPPDR